jgi:hypothetical protein
MSTFTIREPDLLATVFINCWQGAVIRIKCDPAAPCDSLRSAFDRVLSVSPRSEWPERRESTNQSI